MSDKVLIVEDDADNRKILHDMLTSSGYEVIEAEDGFEAVRLRRLHSPAAVLVDIKLPEVSGLEIAKWMKEEAPRLPYYSCYGIRFKG